MIAVVDHQNLHKTNIKLNSYDIIWMRLEQGSWFDECCISVEKNWNYIKIVITLKEIALKGSYVHKVLIKS